MEKRQRWQDGLSLILGFWLFLSPFFGFGISNTAVWNAWLFGLVVTIASVWALTQPRVWEEWINLVVGVWIFIAPFVLGFYNETGALWNHLVVGFVVAADALWVMLQSPVRRTA